MFVIFEHLNMVVIISADEFSFVSANDLLVNIDVLHAHLWGNPWRIKLPSAPRVRFRLVEVSMNASTATNLVITFFMSSVH